MYNTDLPTREELPSSRQLICSTMTAILVAALLLITTVLPAEYGIDPTGVGRLLGLKKMGEIKVSLQEEVANEAEKKSQSITVSNNSTIQSAPEQSRKNTIASINANQSVLPVKNQSHEMTFTLKPGAAVEIKLKMTANAKVDYQWEAKGGLINYNTHGDAAGVSGKSFCYGKGTQVAGDNGVLVTAFDGKHGWFWRNRSEKHVVVTLKTNGQYSEIKRVL